MTPPTTRATRRQPIRILTAVPLCDGHDSAINTINLELIRHGIEVIYLGYHSSAQDIVRAAIQEDVSAIGISSYNGGHVEFFGEVGGDVLGAAGESERLFMLIRQLRAEELAIIYISHRMDEVYALGDRVTVLRDGTLVGALDKPQIRADTIVRMRASSRLAPSANSSRNRLIISRV